MAYIITVVEPEHIPCGKPYMLIDCPDDGDIHLCIARTARGVEIPAEDLATLLDAILPRVEPIFASA